MLIAVLFEIAPELEKPQMLINGGLERQVVAYAFSAVLPTNEKNEP